MSEGPVVAVGFLRDAEHERARADLKRQITDARQLIRYLPPQWHPDHDDAYAALHARLNDLIDHLVDLSRP